MQRGRAAPSRVRAGAAVVLLGVMSGCREDPTIKPANRIPVAEAHIIRDGMSIGEQTEGGPGLSFDFTGTPISITLDATQSYDPDGTITAYRWMSGTLAPDGGTVLPDDAGVMHRWAPPGAPANWPGNDPQPQVELGLGIWYFSLWVVDNQGATSDPDTIKISIGNVVDPVVQKCADAVVSTESEACRQCVCKQSDMCRAAVVASACDQTCWDLVNCVAAHCPNFMAMAAMGDYSCLTNNCMADLAGSSGATPVAPCFNACTSECAGGAGDGGTGEGGGGMDSGDGGA